MTHTSIRQVQVYPIPEGEGVGGVLNAIPNKVLMQLCLISEVNSKGHLISGDQTAKVYNYR